MPDNRERAKEANLRSQQAHRYVDLLTKIAIEFFDEAEKLDSDQSRFGTEGAKLYRKHISELSQAIKSYL